MLAFPFGTEVRSPEIGTPSQHSPMNRDKIVSEVQTASARVVQDAGVTHQRDQFAQPSTVPPVQDPFQSSDTRSTCNAQLRDLFQTLDVAARAARSSSSSSGQMKYVSEDDYVAFKKLIAGLIAEARRESTSSTGDTQKIAQQANETAEQDRR